MGSIEGTALGPGVGASVGEGVGATVASPTHGTPVPKPHFGAAVVGSRLGDSVGAAVGGNVGGFDGASDGSAVGGKGAGVGKGDGAPDVGSGLGDSVGAAVGGNVGGCDGASDGSVVAGKGVGAPEKTVGSIEGTALGPDDGASVGEGVGATVPSPTHGTPVPKPHFGAADVGSRLGDGVGTAVDGNIGGFDGASDGSAVGGKGTGVGKGKGDGAVVVGSTLGDGVGAAVGGNVGGLDGASDGSAVGVNAVGAPEKTVGSIEGTALGPDDGASVGEGVGATVPSPTHGTPVPKPHFGAADVGSRLGDGVGTAVDGNIGGFDGASDGSAVGGKGTGVGKGKGDGAVVVGSTLGDGVGAAVGGNVGGLDGASDGSAVGVNAVGAPEKTVGSIEGTALGPDDGASVGEGVGATVAVGGKVGSDGAVVEGTGVGLQTNKRFGVKKVANSSTLSGCGAAHIDVPIDGIGVGGVVGTAVCETLQASVLHTCASLSASVQFRATPTEGAVTRRAREDVPPPQAVEQPVHAPHAERAQSEQTREEHAAACVKSPVQTAPPYAASSILCRTRLEAPPAPTQAVITFLGAARGKSVARAPAHALEHSCHAYHEVATQSTGQNTGSQVERSTEGLLEHACPPFAGWASTVRVRTVGSEVERPQDLEHALQALHVDSTQSTGHASFPHCALLSLVAGQAWPRPTPGIVTLRERDVLPGPPQLTEHGVQLSHTDTAQLTGAVGASVGAGVTQADAHVGYSVCSVAPQCEASAHRVAAESALAPSKISVSFVTEATFQPPMFWLNAAALRNMSRMSLTLAVFQIARFWSKATAVPNM